MLGKEIKNQVTDCLIIIREKCKPSEKIANEWVFYYQGTQTVPDIIQRKCCFSTSKLRLVFGLNKRSGQFNYIRNVFISKCFRDTIQGFIGQGNIPQWFSLELIENIKTVAANYLLRNGIPDNKLSAGIFIRIKMININGCAKTSTGIAESQFPQSAYFLHEIWGLACSENVDLVTANSCMTNQAISS